MDGRNYTWQRPAGNVCILTGDSFFFDSGPTANPRVLITVARPYARPRILFLRDHRPRLSHFRAFKRLDAHGFPTDGRRVRYRLRPRRANGHVTAWVVRFRVNVVSRPYFNLFARFPERGEGFCREAGSVDYASFAIGLN